MILTETHLHTKEVSPCGNVSAKEIPSLYKEKCYGNIIVTDHFKKDYLERLSSNKNKALDLWLKGYRIVREEGEKIGVNVFLGMEIALNESENEYLIYGITQDFVLQSDGIFDLKINELYKLVKENGFLIYQAHPFRNYCSPQKCEYLDGIEVYNGNMRHNSHNDKALAYAAANNMRISSGSDFHEYEDLAHGGIYLPEYVKTNFELVKYLSTNVPELKKS